MRISITAVTAACLAATPSAAAIPIEQHVEAVVSHLVGSMDTSAQAAANPDKANVRMTTCKLEVDNAAQNSAYLYQEQALSDELDQPYRQRFLEITPSDDAQTVISKSYQPSNPETLINFCDQSAAERQVQLSDFGEPVCSVFLKPLLAVYVGQTPSGGCAANVRGAVTITNTIVLHSQGMDTFDRGFDAEGKQVWGAKDESYQFRWLNQ